jgi:hypothetical protein
VPGVGGNAHRRVVMKASPLAPFVMSQADFLFEFLVVAFDPEAEFGEINQPLDRTLIILAFLRSSSILFRNEVSVWRRLDCGRKPAYQARAAAGAVRLTGSSSIQFQE